MKRKRKKRRKEKKRSEEKKVLPRFELGPFGTPGDSFTTRPCGTHTQNCGIFIIKTFESAPPLLTQTIIVPCD